MKRAGIGVAALASLVAASPAEAEAPDRWQLAASGVGQYDIGSRYGGGVAAELVGGAEGARRFGVRVETVWIAPHGDEFDAWQIDALFVARGPVTHRPAFSLDLEGGVGVTRYAGEVDIPVVPDCWGCGRYGGAEVRPMFSFGLDSTTLLGRGLSLRVGCRAQVVPVLAGATDVHNFLPAPLALALDVGIGSRF